MNDDGHPFEGLAAIAIAVGLAMFVLRACGWLLTGR